MGPYQVLLFWAGVDMRAMTPEGVLHINQIRRKLYIIYIYIYIYIRVCVCVCVCVCVIHLTYKISFRKKRKIFFFSKFISININSPLFRTKIILIMQKYLFWILQNDSNLKRVLWDSTEVCHQIWTSIDKIRENGFELTKKRSRRYSAKTITDADYSDDIAILANTPNQAETLLHSLERAAAGIGLYVNAHKTEYMCYNQTGDISTLDETPLKLVDEFTYLGSSVESTEKDIDARLTKAWTAINRLSIIWKSDLTDKMKRSFFQADVASTLLYGCTTWTLKKWLEKKLDGNFTRMLRAILNKSWRQHPTRHQLYSQLPPITKTIQVRRTKHAEHC